MLTAIRRKTVIQIVLVLFVLAIGLGIAHHFISTKPKVPRRKVKPHIPVVQVETIKPQNFLVTIESFGTVKALRTGSIVSETSGRVIYISPNLLPGGRFKKGEVLVRLDSSDYKAALAMAKAELEEAKRAYEEIKAQAEAARQEWEDVLKEKTPPPPLVVKQPQIAAAKARIKAAQAKYEKARLDLERTVIRAPFDGLVTESKIELGQYLGKGSLVAKAYEVRAVEIAVPLSLEEIKWIQVPGFNAKKGSKAKVSLETLNATWSGRVVRSAAKANEKTRLIDIYVRVKNPLKAKVALVPGLFVKVELTGRTLKNVFILPRNALYFQEGKWLVYTVKNGRLIQKDIKVVLFDQRDRAIVREGLKPGDQLILTRLSKPVPGMKVHIKP
ncbi:efflux transporter, RND family, MFP subunit [Thermodesulfatator indicus DSM 15286]|uniref:Efflux transporter, RND family, MFP subunit n=1 Tax=Thermodesulfatator indicus (strain DSM 15286 / JCM 11887 / CIR29812) TaxID=667014 RepID=F8ABA5_THEID|nr:efflux RND transporter periplasmic adaptor subunit [Thermodesulfatator indicus]AEH45567.1 efflux transporter, RND family, MFP subunit [Thermodesulfatator indicus DSM 15286]